MSNCGCKTQPLNTPCTTCSPAASCGCTTKCSCATTSLCGKSSKYSEQKAGPVKIVAMHSLKIISPWVIPALGQKATVLVESSSVANGSEVYSELYGWFITGDYDASNNSLTLLNSTAASVNALNGLTMNEIGKPVPGCATFAVGTPSNGSGTSTGAQRCLLGQFYSKGVSDGTDPALVMSTQLSSIDGISPGDRIFFGVYEYIVKNIFTGNRVDFYNAGAGATAGTLVSGGLDCNGNCLLIVTIVGGSSPCEALEVQEVASLIGCNGNILQPFTSLIDNSIPVWDAASQSWKPEVVAVDTTVCVTITAGFTITGGDPGPYTIAINDSTVLEVGDILKVAGREEYFTVTAKPDDTHITVTVAPTFPGLNDFNCGDVMCVLTCCEAQDLCPFDTINYRGFVSYCAANVITWGGATGDFSFISQDINGGAPFLSVENTTNCRQHIRLSITLTEFHNNINNTVSPGTPILLAKARYHWNLLSDSSITGSAIAIGAGMVLTCPSRPCTFPDQTFGIASVSLDSFFQHGTICLPFNDTIEPGETKEYSMQERHTYDRLAGTETGAADNMCAVFQFEATVTKGITQ